MHRAWPLQPRWSYPRRVYPMCRDCHRPGPRHGRTEGPRDTEEAPRHGGIDVPPLGRFEEIDEKAPRAEARHSPVARAARLPRTRRYSQRAARPPWSWLPVPLPQLLVSVRSADSPALMSSSGWFRRGQGARRFERTTVAYHVQHGLEYSLG